MINRVSLVCILAIVLCSCYKERLKGRIITGSKLADELRASPTSINIGNNNFLLTASLWRDFMPQNDQGGSRLMSTNYLTDIDSLPVPPGLKLVKQYVIYGDEIWANSYSEINNDQPFILQGISRDGPRWGPDVFVDVVCEFKIENNYYEVIAKHQQITATY